jgi:hypothetical protein
MKLYKGFLRQRPPDRLGTSLGQRREGVAALLSRGGPNLEGGIGPEEADFLGNLRGASAEKSLFQGGGDMAEPLAAGEALDLEAASEGESVLADPLEESLAQAVAQTAQEMGLDGVGRNGGLRRGREGVGGGLGGGIGG